MKSLRFPRGRGLTLSIATEILKDLDTPYSNRLLLLLRKRDFAGFFQSLSFPDLRSECYDVVGFASDYLAYSLLRKVDWDIGVDRSSVAVESFLESEQSCRTLNWAGYSWTRLRPSDPTSYHAVIHTAARLIQKVLGRFSWESASEHFRFTSGASIGHRRSAGDPFYKFGSDIHVTRSVVPLLSTEIRLTPLWRELDPELRVVAASRSATVPKNWKTDRFICIEPEGNMRYQSAIGALIRRKLRRVGIDLNDQSRNKSLARLGSSHDDLATIDLSAASDSISLALCHDLLPPDWLDAIERCRVPSTTLPSGEVVELHKVSSMGNGFTFELESLIFWALARSVTEIRGFDVSRIGVYGDDIIVPSVCAEDVIDVLSMAGFKTNVDKTFSSGPFRESCGGHYYLGSDVSPFSIRTDISAEERCYLLLNQYAEWCERIFGELRPGFFRVKSLLDKFIKDPCYVPNSYPDSSGYKCTIPGWYCRWSTRGWAFKALLPVRRRHKPSGVPALLSWFSHHVGSDTDWWLDTGSTVYRRIKRWSPELR